MLPRFVAILAGISLAGLSFAGDFQNPPRNWGLDAIDQRGGRDGVFRPVGNGTGVSLYVVDTGVLAAHVDFRDAQGNPRVTYVGDFCTGTIRKDSNQTYDDGYDGHGTHNASYAAGREAGVATNARIYSLRAQGPGGPVSADGRACGDNNNQGALKAAVEWITANGRKPGVVNISFAFPSITPCGAGDGTCVSDLLSTIRKSIAAGFVYTLSGGSGGPVPTHWGSELAKEALVVAGTDRANTPLGSKYGPLLALFAPAQGLYGASASDADAYTVPEAVACNPRCPPAGDSFGAPFVAGVAATYLERHPRASPAEVKQAIVAAATVGIVKVDSSGEPNRFLYSRLSR
jgi:subtilisin family serine protease